MQLARSPYLLLVSGARRTVHVGGEALSQYDTIINWGVEVFDGAAQ